MDQRPSPFSFGFLASRVHLCGNALPAVALFARREPLTPAPVRILLARFALHRIASFALSADFEPARSVVLPPQDRP
jgi:hypothetical protein